MILNLYPPGVKDGKEVFPTEYTINHCPYRAKNVILWARRGKREESFTVCSESLRTLLLPPCKGLDQLIAAMIRHCIRVFYKRTHVTKSLSRWKQRSHFWVNSEPLTTRLLDPKIDVPHSNIVTTVSHSVIIYWCSNDLGLHERCSLPCLVVSLEMTPLSTQVRKTLQWFAGRLHGLGWAGLGHGLGHRLSSWSLSTRGTGPGFQHENTSQGPLREAGVEVSGGSGKRRGIAGSSQDYTYLYRHLGYKNGIIPV